MGFFEAVVLAFLGGVLLNLMPCVLPVLAVKVSALASMGEQARWKRLRHAMGYAAGTVATMAALALGVIALQAMGQTVGWGFQFQHPLFVIALSAVMVLFALNLFGVYEIGVPPGANKLGRMEVSGDRRSFFEGILAVVLATPCTAPFMGTAIGFAMTSHPLVIISVVTSLGLGLAAPFVAVAVMPGFSKVMPRPGSWMGVMKKVLGFALMLTALWLVWVFGRQMGADAMTGLLGFLIALSFAAWLYGEVQYREVGKLKLSALAMASIAVALGAWVGLGDLEEGGNAATEGQHADGASAGIDGGADQPATLTDDGEINWQTWSSQVIADALDAGRPVFVNFTADWCVTCKTNESSAIGTTQAKEAAADTQVVMVKADLTQTDDRLVDELATFGRSGVPLYLLYDPASPDEPEILAQILTPQSLVDAFGELR